MDLDAYSDSGSTNSLSIKSPLEELYDLQTHSFDDELGAQPLTEDAVRFRLNRIRRSQQEYDRLFNRLDDILNTLNEKQSIALASDDHTYHLASPASPQSGGGASYSPSSVGGADYRRHSKADVLSTEYPKYVEYNSQAYVILGPHGTMVQAEGFEQILWDSAPAATRSLLCLVFSSDVLATHTLTGKPSPAFYGRERPPKLQLDSHKVNDIITCVRVKCGCKERDVRAAITTKCADTAKKLKRRSEKDLELRNMEC